jgi:drug/metabolite transporter (DMT)-like permease
MKLPWYIASLAAAVVWGVHYPLVDNALRKLSLVTVLVLTAVPLVLLAPFFHKTLAADYEVLKNLGWAGSAPILALALTSLAGSVLLFMSIDSKNATLASVIEISYPLFVGLFAYLLFRHMHVNASVILGGLLVFAGVVIIILNNP